MFLAKDLTCLSNLKTTFNRDKISDPVVCKGNIFSRQNFVYDDQSAVEYFHQPFLGFSIKHYVILLAVK